MADSQNGRLALAAGGLAAFFASACCLGPLILVTLGLIGAWISNLTVLDPYRSAFIGVALISLVFAYRRIFRAKETCTSGQVCARPQVNKAYKILFGVVAALHLHLNQHMRTLVGQVG